MGSLVVGSLLGSRVVGRSGDEVGLGIVVIRVVIVTVVGLSVGRGGTVILVVTVLCGGGGVSWCWLDVGSVVILVVTDVGGGVS